MRSHAKYGKGGNQDVLNQQIFETMCVIVYKWCQSFDVLPHSPILKACYLDKYIKKKKT